MSNIEHYWKEGKHIDLWSVVHTLSGVALGSILFYFEMDITIALVIALMLFVGWEAVEVALGIKEHATNMVMDVVFDFLGFFGVLYFYRGLDMSINISIIIYSCVALLFFSTWGFLAHKRRTREGESHLQ
ncbi:MAG TPA: hypothetical protein PLD99_01785 [Parcubacteria group bacterium]|nr:hypothetical protein [Parcubacteria group bacterium]